MKTRILLASLLITHLTFGVIHITQAQLFGKKKKQESTQNPKPEEPKKGKTIAQETKGKAKFDGLFTLYQDSTSGALSMVVTQEQINKDFIHFYYVENGVSESGSFRGQFRGSRILSFSKYFNKLEISIKNTSYYFDSTNSISKSAAANRTNAVVFSADIKATSEEDSAFLINVDKLFLSETLGFIKPPAPAKPNPNAFNLGKLSRDKTKYIDIRNYPENTDLVIDYVYQNPNPRNSGSPAVTDARSVTITVQHSFIAVPDNDFQPRYDDPRIGYFTQKVTDLTSKTSTPYRDMIDRWHLVKKYPDSAISEPIEPIVWWMENTTPEEIRQAIIKAGQTWNQAFEKAGFKNALIVKQQPDTADWDAGDIRYNVLRWTSSPRPLFGGYGPHFVNPLTGQILGADIMLEYSVLTTLPRLEKVFESGSEADWGDFMEFDEHACHAGLLGQEENAFASTTINILDADEQEKSKMMQEWVYYLIIHEMGHTLGLNHNMKSSNLHGIADIHNEALTNEVGLVGSIMEYPSVNICPDRSKQGQYYPLKPGPYDHWAIEYGYKPVASEAELTKILQRSTDPQLAFGNDADDMRWPGKGIDPSVNVYDLTSDAVTYASERIQLSKRVMNQILEKYKSVPNSSYQDLLTAYRSLLRETTRSSEVISRFIGGVYVDRSFTSQNGAGVPFTPVPLADQRQAMRILSKEIFAPDAFDFDNEIYNYLLPQRRGFNHFQNHEDPRIHDSYLSIQRNILNHLLHPTVLKRIVDSEVYGNDYTLSLMMLDLHKAMFTADAGGSVNSIRQNLQIEYVNRLISILKDKSRYSHNIHAMAHANLKKARGIASHNIGNSATKAHRQYLTYLIDKGFEMH